jgi:hypothetical protein
MLSVAGENARAKNELKFKSLASDKLYQFRIHQQIGLQIYGKASIVQRFNPLNFLKSHHVHSHENDIYKT